MTVVRMGCGISARLYVAGFFLVMLCWPVQAIGDISKSIAAGDQAMAIKDHLVAEKIYTEVLQTDLENFRVMKSLAEVKIVLKKFQEAETLLGQILAMEVSNGKKVLVTLEGETEPLEAELVDETVILKEDSKNNMRNYLTPVLPEPVPHYRLFFFKTGKMELVPKRRAKIQYKGVPRHVQLEVTEMQGQVKMKLIESGGSKGPEEMVALDGGCFKMGTDKGEPDERPVHEVCVSAFKMDKYEVTQREFQLKMGTNMSLYKGADLPVESVTWIEADQYCMKSNKRLPTEAEWEYAARAGSSTEYTWGDEFDTGKANYCDKTCAGNLKDMTASDGFPVTAPVGSFPANAFGLHDMAGNVYEWVADWMEEKYYLLSPKNNPKGPVRAERVMRGGTNTKVFRGGSWSNAAPELRSANRKALWVDYRIEDLGFRCAADQ
jgi:formylglycine-generating enzyme required for sulfatase activity